MSPRATRQFWIREPGVVRWPGRLAAGGTVDTPVLSTDLAPTLLDAAGVAVPDGHFLDGVSLLPRLRGDGTIGGQRHVTPRGRAARRRALQQRWAEYTAGPPIAPFAKRPTSRQPPRA